MENYRWRWFRAGRMSQVRLENGEDLAHLRELDRKRWLAISMPVKGVRFDRRMLELMDSDGDGRIRMDEVLAAVDFVKAKGVDLDSLFKPDVEGDGKRLAEVLSRQADLAKVEPSADDKAALAAWTAKENDPAIAILGAATATADAALAAVEGVIDGFFAPPADMPLVTEAPDCALPLRDHLNPKHLEAILDFAAKCVEPLVAAGALSLRTPDTLSRMEWKAVKAAFAPYRAWIGAKPVMSANAKAELEEEEKLLRYKLHLVEFLENFVNMRHLYAKGDMAIFQTGILRIDARELNLCFHVESEAAHSALSEKSNCCVIYLKLARPADAAERLICAVVTAGKVGTLYVGRNGIFIDRDGKDWEAVVTKIVESQVSLVEAFWAPWKKLGESIGAMATKFLGERQTKAFDNVQKGTESTQAGGAAMASSVAAIGIGIGMVGTAAAAIVSAIRGIQPWWMLFVAIAAVILVVSLPSVILTWFKLRKRDIGAILNASGWAINRPMRFSMARARGFTIK